MWLQNLKIQSYVPLCEQMKKYKMKKKKMDYPFKNRKYQYLLPYNVTFYHVSGHADRWIYSHFAIPLMPFHQKLPPKLLIFKPFQHVVLLRERRVVFLKFVFVSMVNLTSVNKVMPIHLETFFSFSHAHTHTHLCFCAGLLMQNVYLNKLKLWIGHKLSDWVGDQADWHVQHLVCLLW